MASKTDSDSERRAQAVDFAIATIEKQHGKGAIMRMGEQKIVPVEGIPTGALSLDLAIGCGGVPRGRIVEIFGPESSGKTTLTLHIVANAQKGGGVAAFIDAEHALDPSYSKKLGVDFENLLVSQPDTGEQALEIAEVLVRSNAIDVIVIDSVAALVPKAEIEGEMGEPHVGLQARLMSQALRKLTAAVARSRACLIFINQLREKIGVMFGSPETTPGGRALKFYSSVRLDIRKVGRLKEGEETIGGRVKVTVVKNKVAPPFRLTEFDVLFDGGISLEGDLLDLGELHKVLDRTGTWYSFKETKLGQGRDRARVFLRENPEIRDALRAAIVLKLAPAPAAAPAAPAGTLAAAAEDGAKTAAPAAAKKARA